MATKKKKTPKKKSTIKSKTKKAGRKIKKAAKTDVGRAGIGGGIGALALGPVGAVAGAGIAMATKKKRKKNPARAFSLETEIKKGRQSRAKGAAGKATRASSAASTVSGVSLRKKLAKINPGTYEGELPGMTMSGLEKEHKALTSLIKRAERHSETSGRMTKDLRSLRTAVVAEKRRRRRTNPAAKPKKNPVSSGLVTDKTLAQYAAAYRRKRQTHLKLLTSPGSSPGSIARAKKKLDDAERQLILYAEIRNMDPVDLQRFMEYAASKKRSAQKKRKSNPSTTPKVSARDLNLVSEMPNLGTLGSYPRAVNLWESIYIGARVRGSSKESSRKQAWGGVKKAGYYQDTKGYWRMPRRRFNPGEHPKENPLKKIPRNATERSARTIISKNISTEMKAGRPQRQAVAISLASARRDSPKMMEKLYGPYPNPYLGDAVGRAKTKKKAAAKRKRSTPPPPPTSARRKSKAHTVAATNPTSPGSVVDKKTLSAASNAVKKGAGKSAGDRFSSSFYSTDGRLRNRATTYRDLQKRLKEFGFEFVRQKGSHQIYRSPLGKTVSIPMKSRGSKAVSPHYEKQIRAAMNPSRIKSFSMVHVLLLDRLSRRAAQGASILPVQLKAYRELESAGLIDVVSCKGPYQDPEAGPEEGEVPLYDVSARITDVGRVFVRDNRIEDLMGRSGRAALAQLLRGEVPKRTLNPKKKPSKKKSPKRNGASIAAQVLARLLNSGGASSFTKLDRRKIEVVRYLALQDIIKIHTIEGPYTAKGSDAPLRDVTLSLTKSGKRFLKFGPNAQEKGDPILSAIYSRLRERHKLRRASSAEKAAALAAGEDPYGLETTRVLNPKKKAARKKTPKYQLLINRCQKLWDNYCDKPTKKNLKLVLAHLEKMKESTSEKVKEERSRCLRAANKEAKRLKVK